MVIRKESYLAEVTEQAEKMMLDCSLLIFKRKQLLLNNETTECTAGNWEMPQWDVSAYAPYVSLASFDITRQEWNMLSIIALRESKEWGQIFVPSDYCDLEPLAMAFSRNRSNKELQLAFRNGIKKHVEKKFGGVEENAIIDWHVTFRKKYLTCLLYAFCYIADSIEYECDISSLIHSLICNYILAEINCILETDMVHSRLTNNDIDLSYGIKLTMKLDSGEKSVPIFLPALDMAIEEEQLIKKKRMLMYLLLNYLDLNQDASGDNQASDQIGIITEKDTIVKSQIKHCTNNAHDVVDMIAKVQAIYADGSIRMCAIAASYCQNCNEYYILTDDFKKLRGVPICQVYELPKNVRLRDLKQSYFGYFCQSRIYAFGYNVNANNQLTVKQRRGILSRIIEQNVLSRAEVISHLNFLIAINHSKPSYAYAIRKWRADKEFLLNQIHGQDSYLVKDLYVRDSPIR